MLGAPFLLWHRLDTNNRPLPSSLGKGLFLPELSTPRKALPSNSSLGIAIPKSASSPRASGGSREGGRGIEGEHLKSWGQEKGPFCPHQEGAVLARMGSYGARPRSGWAPRHIRWWSRSVGQFLGVSGWGTDRRNRFADGGENAIGLAMVIAVRDVPSAASTD